MTSATSGEKPTIAVWDPLVRVLHWALATCVIVSFASHEGPEWLHFWSGYGALAIAIIRVIVGFAGSPYARFRQFIVGPRATISYSLDVLKHREKHYVGHNPLGAWMIVALLASVIAVGVTGVLLDTDRFWAHATLEAVHSFFGHLFIPLVVLHVAGVIFTSFRQKENLVTAMITGRKTPPGDGT